MSLDFPEDHVPSPREFVELLSLHVADVETTVFDPEYEQGYIAKHGEDAWLEFQNIMLDHSCEMKRLRNDVARLINRGDV